MKQYKLIKSYPGMKYDPCKSTYSTDSSRADYPEFWEEIPEFKAGVYVVVLDSDMCSYKAGGVHRIKSVEIDRDFIRIHTENGNGWGSDHFRLATKDEIFEALKLECIKRGISKDSVVDRSNISKFKSINQNIQHLSEGAPGDDYEYHDWNDEFSVNGWIVYFQGVWAKLVSNKPKFKVGDWVTMDHWKIVYKVEEVLNDALIIANSYGESYGRDVRRYPFSSDIRLATAKEIEKHLIEEATKRGFVAGCEFYSAFDGIKHTLRNGVFVERDGEYHIHDRDKFGGNYVYYKDKWAEIVKQLPKFKAGDYVVAIDSTGNQYTAGKVYVVKSLSSRDQVIDTEFDDKGATNNGWHISHFRLATEKEIEDYKISRFKVGDYVYKLKKESNCTEAKVGGVYKILAIQPNGKSIKLYTYFDLSESANSCWFKPENFRLATAEEIRNAKKPEVITIAGYDGRFGSQNVSFGCRSYSKPEVDGLIRVMKRFDIASVDIITGGSVTTVLKSTITKIRDRMV